VGVLDLQREKSVTVTSAYVVDHTTASFRQSLAVAERQMSTSCWRITFFLWRSDALVHVHVCNVPLTVRA